MKDDRTTVPAGPVREHVQTLLDGGRSKASICRSAGVTLPTLRRILGGEDRVLRSTATFLLNVTPNEVVPGCMVDADLVRSMLERLAASDLPKAWVMRKAQLNPRLRIPPDATRVRWLTYYRIKLVYDTAEDLGLLCEAM